MSGRTPPCPSAAADAGEQASTKTGDAASIAGLRAFAWKRLRLASFFERPGDGRVYPQIPASDLMWGLVCGQVLREGSHRGVEMLAAQARRALSLSGSFGDDALSYFTDRLSLATLRTSLAGLARRAKRNKAFADRRLIGIALDGSKLSYFSKPCCELCVPIYNAKHEIVGYHHQVSMAAIVGGKLSLPVDVEPYGQRDSELGASKRLLTRVVKALGKRFADYVVVDALYAGAPFLHLVGRLGKRVVARLRDNLPNLANEAKKRFESMRPTCTFKHGEDRVELWDSSDFDPWDGLGWKTVRVIRYRQYKPDGDVVEASWLTDFTRAEASGEEIFLCAKSRWQIENEGFNDAKSRYGFEHTSRHTKQGVIAGWLISLLAITIERLFRVRFLCRGGRPVLSAIALLRIIRYTPGPQPRPRQLDTG